MNRCPADLIAIPRIPTTLLIVSSAKLLSTMSRSQRLNCIQYSDWPNTVKQDCVRLVCYHLFHWVCLERHCRALPPRYKSNFPFNFWWFTFPLILQVSILYPVLPSSTAFCWLPLQLLNVLSYHPLQYSRATIMSFLFFSTAPAGYTCPCCSSPIFPPDNLVSPVADKLRQIPQVFPLDKECALIQHVTGCQLGSRGIRSPTFARKVDWSCQRFEISPWRAAPLILS